MLVDEVGTYVLSIRAAISQAGESKAARQRREMVVSFVLLSPLVLGLLITALPPPKGK